MAILQSQKVWYNRFVQPKWEFQEEFVARTYLTGLVKIVYQLCKYTTRYGAAINSVLDSPEKELFAALIASCNAFMQSTIVEQARSD